MADLKHLRDLIRAAVKERVGTGVGAVLSGGIDSSTIVKMAGRHVPTFTGWYDAKGFDERPYARLVAGHTHHEVKITPADFVEHFDEMMTHARPPLQGPGMFGQYMVARYASKFVDTVLSGEGGDELFGGYARLMKVAGHPVPPGYENYTPPADYPDTLEAALQYDWDRLPDLLAVDEQMTGAFGLAAHAPFTDPRVVDYVLSLSAEERVGKKLLKQAMDGILPEPILERKDKMGFPIPLVQWAQGPLREFVHDRIGYIPDPAKPFDRGWWYDLCEATRVAA